MRQLPLMLGATTGAVFSSLVPVSAFVTLSPAEYGHFSIPYLLFAFGISLQLSVVSEAWLRTRVQRNLDSTWPEYFGAILALSLLVGAVTTALMLAIPATRDLGWFGLAAFAALMRSGARYYVVARGMNTRVVLADTVGSVTFFAVLVPSMLTLDGITATFLAWTASSIAAWVALPKPALNGASSPRRWVRTHSASIRPLLADSLLLDLGSVGTPFLLAPFLGALQFGLYRGISNVALPARLILDPLRPKIAGSWASRLATPMGIGSIIAIGTALGAACFVVLGYVVPALHLTLGTLTALSAFAVPSGVYVVAAFVGQVFYVVCRGTLAPRRLMAGRVTQTVVSVALPLVGCVMFGLDGAVWGFVLSTVLPAVVWLLLAVSHGRGAAPHEFVGPADLDGA